MAVYFLDSSALVKRYVSEMGSTQVLEIFDLKLDNEVFIASIAGVEIIAAISRRVRGGSISSVDATVLCNQVRNDYEAEYQIIDITNNIVSSGMMLAETYGLRGYDAIQLAVGCAVNTVCLASSVSLRFVSADNELNTAASKEGITVVNPTEYL